MPYCFYDIQLTDTNFTNNFYNRLCAEKYNGQMDGVDLIFKVAAIGILVAVLNVLLVRAGREDQAMMTTIAGLVVVLMVVLREISGLFDTIKSLFGL